MARIGRPPTCDCSVCKKCKQRVIAARWYAKKSLDERREIVARRDPEKKRASDRSRHLRHREARLDAMAFYRHAHPELVATRSREQRLKDRQKSDEAKRLSNARHPERARARNIASSALRRGKIERGQCSQADPHCRGRIEMHHPDYSKPLEVVWLCRGHHAAAHRIRGRSVR